MIKLVVTFGTRPEIIKLAPVIQKLESRKGFNIVKIHTGQHDGLAQDMLSLFGIKPDHNLKSLASTKDLFELTEFLLPKLKTLFLNEQPDGVIVQGDTTSSYLCAMAAFYLKIPVFHVEAGLRSFDIYNPFPEEINRKQITTVSELHFVPTEIAKQNLLNEHVDSKKVFNTGNTVIDALFQIRNSEKYNRSKPSILEEIEPSQKLILVTAHRSENIGKPLRSILSGLIDILNRDDSRLVLLPVHPNPKVREIVEASEFSHKRLRVIEPLDYLSFQHVLDRSDLVLTDSGGIQEEAAALGKKLLVLRKTTERTELINNGYTKLVGSETKLIAKEANKMLMSSDSKSSFNPYGNGDASEKIAEIISSVYYS